MEKVIVEFRTITSPEGLETSGWWVIQGDREADHLAYDEMIGLFAQLTMPEKRACLRWMKTKEQREAWEDHLKKISNKENQDATHLSGIFEQGE